MFVYAYAAGIDLKFRTDVPSSNSSQCDFVHFFSQTHLRMVCMHCFSSITWVKYQARLSFWNVLCSSYLGLGKLFNVGWSWFAGKTLPSNQFLKIRFKTSNLKPGTIDEFHWRTLDGNDHIFLLWSWLTNK